MYSQHRQYNITTIPEDSYDSKSTSIYNIITHAFIKSINQTLRA